MGSPPRTQPVKADHKTMSGENFTAGKLQKDLHTHTHPFFNKTLIGYALPI